MKTSTPNFLSKIKVSRFSDLMLFFLFFFFYTDYSAAMPLSCYRIYQTTQLSLFEFAQLAHNKYPTHKNLDVDNYVHSGLETGKMLLLYTSPLNTKSNKAILINQIFIQAEQTLKAQWAYADIINYYVHENIQSTINKEDFENKTSRAKMKFSQLYAQPLQQLLMQLLPYFDPQNPQDIGFYQTLLLTIAEFSAPNSDKLELSLHMPKINNSRR